jgi:hypothetical protein
MHATELNNFEKSRLSFGRARIDALMGPDTGGIALKLGEGGWE